MFLSAIPHKFSTLEASIKRVSRSHKSDIEVIIAWEGQAKTSLSLSWYDSLASVTLEAEYNLSTEVDSLPPTLPGHIWVLSEEQQNVLRVDEECPAGEATEEQDECPPLQDDPHVLQVLAPKCLGSTGKQTR